MVKRDTEDSFNALSSPKTNNDESSIPHPLENTSVISSVFMFWMDKLIRHGDVVNCLWETYSKDKAKYLNNVFEPYWQAEKANTTTNSPRFERAMFKMILPRLVVAVITLFISIACSVLQPLFIQAILQYLKNPSSSSSEYYNNPITLVIGFTLVSVCTVTFLDISLYVSTRLGCHVRTIVTTTMYQHVLSSLSTQKASSKVVTLATMDSERLYEAAVLGWHSFTATGTMVLAMVLIGLELGIASAAAGSLLLVLSIYTAFAIGRAIGRTRREAMRQSAARVGETSQALNGIRVLKMYGWEKVMEKSICNIRKDEMRVLRKFHFLRVLNRIILLVMPNFVGALCFIVYIAMGNTLNVPQAFTVLGFVNVLRLPAAILPNAVTYFSEGMASAKRVSEFLKAPTETDKVEEIPRGSIELKDASFAWEDNTFILRNLNLSIAPGELVMIVGSVGSGKSSLMQGLIKTMKLIGGSCQVGGKVAYVSQSTWMPKGRLKDAILFYSTMKQERYLNTLTASQLVRDLDSLPSRDETDVGHNGSNLSGGQKARVAIARAIYPEDTNVLLMDDPLSALDSRVANAVFENVVSGVAKKQTRVLILNTHYHLLQRADKVIVMKDGGIYASGSYEEVRHLIKNNQYSNDTLDEDDEKETGTSSSSPVTTQETTPLKEERKTGAVTFQTYVKYFAASGISAVVILFSILLVFTLGQASQTAGDWYIGEWAAASNKSLELYIAITLLTAFLVTFRSLFFVHIAMICSKVLHRNILHRVFNAPVNTFFDVTPIGRILYRFSRDVDLMDSTLPDAFVTLLQFLFQVLAVFVVCGASVPFLLVLYVPLIACFYAVHVYYQRTSRELKRLDATSRSPIVQYLTETLEGGLSIIRVFQVEKKANRRFMSLVDENSRFFHTYAISTRWLAMRLDWLSVTLIATVTSIIFATKDAVDVKTAGLALVYAVQLTSFLQRTVSLASMTENVMTSVERLFQYECLSAEGDTFKDNEEGCLDHDGSITFVNASMRYRENLDLTLKNISLKVPARAKVGICGRTGSGKSSLISALFRFAECESAGSIFIGEIDITSVTVSSLRKELSIIPQDPVLFTGSVRHNLDPYGEVKNDKEIYDVLQQVCLTDFVTSIGGIDTGVLSTNFSVGQRQLLCIARALLRPTKIFILDEATASVDAETDLLIQQTIRKYFKEQTVLCIAPIVLKQYLTVR